jgi:uncharacterized protein (TIGR03083 family)
MPSQRNGDDMTARAIPALQTQVRHAKELFVTLTPAEWASNSGCDGWRVQDVAQHMASVFQQIADPASIDFGDSGKAEVSAEVPVSARRDWTVDEVMAAYDEWSEKGVAALGALQEPPMSDAVVPLSDLGSHPLHLLANAIVFDHYCHLRVDIGAAVERAAALPREDDALATTLEWMLAGLPQMCAAELAAAPAETVNLAFEGPGGGDFVLAPGDAGWTVNAGTSPDAPTIVSTVHDFVSWGTKRSDWRGQVSGDTDRVAPVLDAINII